MRRILKGAAFGFAGLVLLGGLALGFVYLATSSRMDRVYHVNPGPVQILAATLEPGGDDAGHAGGGPNGADLRGAAREASAGRDLASALAWGEHIATTRGCTDCHGEDLGGGLFADAMPVFRLYGSNLTPGGVGSDYSDGDWIQAIRHGIGPDGKPLLFMPSYEYYFLGDRDLAALILYLKSLPPVTRELPRNTVGPVGRALFMVGKLPLLSAELIDHDAPRPATPPRGATVEYGAYLAKGCIGCHGETLSGGPIPGVPPEWPAAPNLTRDPDTGLAGWSREDFFRAMREGRRPDGTQLRAEFMPWPNMGKLHDDELEGLWMYLEMLEARPFGRR